MKVLYRPHLKRRIRQRAIPHDYPRKVYQQAKMHFIDILTGHHIAISKMQYAGKLRNLVVSYDIINTNVEIITIHPISYREINKRLISKRWRKNEKRQRKNLLR